MIKQGKLRKKNFLLFEIAPLAQCTVELMHYFFGNILYGKVSIEKKCDISHKGVPDKFCLFSHFFSCKSNSKFTNAHAFVCKLVLKTPQQLEIIILHPSSSSYSYHVVSCRNQATVCPTDLI